IKNVVQNDIFNEDCNRVVGQHEETASLRIFLFSPDVHEQNMHGSLISLNHPASLFFLLYHVDRERDSEPMAPYHHRDWAAGSSLRGRQRGAPLQKPGRSLE